MNFSPINTNDYKQVYNINSYNYAETALKGEMKICSDDRNLEEVAKLYFQKANMKRIQRMIKKEVFRRTKGKYKLEADQDERDLLVSMKAVYTEYAVHLPDKVIRQVKNLNKKLIEYIIKDVIIAIEQYYAYIEDINQPLKPMIRPVNVNSAGRKTLPPLTSVWGF